MRLGQTYETTLVSHDNQYAVRIISIPARAIHEAYRNILDDLARATEAFDGQLMQPIPSLMRLPVAVSAIVENPSDARYAVFRMLSAIEHPQTDTFSSSILAFAEQISYAELIPFETSPISLHTLADIASYGATTATSVGLVAITHNPWLLITVPTGIVLCGAAQGVSKGLKTGLEYWTLRLLKAPVASTTEPEPPEHAGRRPRHKGW